MTKVGADTYEIPDPALGGGRGGDPYRVCWRPTKQGPGFPVDASGQVRLVGPGPIEELCTRGVTCEITLRGHGLSAPANVRPAYGSRTRL